MPDPEDSEVSYPRGLNENGLTADYKVEVQAAIEVMQDESKYLHLQSKEDIDHVI